MGSHPLNLAVRFILEVLALISFGTYGWNQTEGWMRFVAAIGLPLLFAAAWAIFAVPDDPSRSGAAPVVTPGLLRLVLELAFFAFATWCLRENGHLKSGLVFGIVVLIHYVVSYDRIVWLLKH